MRVWTREIRVFPATRQFTNSKNIKHKIGPKTLAMYQCNNRMKNANYCKWLIVSEVDDRRQYMNYVFFFSYKNEKPKLHVAFCWQTNQMLGSITIFRSRFFTAHFDKCIHQCRRFDAHYTVFFRSLYIFGFFMVKISVCSDCWPHCIIHQLECAFYVQMRQTN